MSNKFQTILVALVLVFSTTGTQAWWNNNSGYSYGNDPGYYNNSWSNSWGSGRGSGDGGASGYGSFSFSTSARFSADTDWDADARNHGRYYGGGYNSPHYYGGHPGYGPHPAAPQPAPSTDAAPEQTQK